jgi:hypothetical protein
MHHNNWKFGRHCCQALSFAALSLLAGCAVDAGEEPLAAEVDELFGIGALWPNGTVKVCWSQSSFNHPNFHDYAPIVRQRANEEWPTAARVSVVGWLGCPANTNGMTVINLNEDSEANAATGYFPTSATSVMNLGTNRFEFETDTVPHEFGHVLGFNHEHQRDDWRLDRICEIPNNGRIEDDGSNFPAGTGTKWTTPDDFSIMNYCSDADTLSDLDRQGVATAYGARVSRFGTSTSWTTTWSPSNHFFADVNGDGRADLIGRSGTDVKVALSTGTGFGTVKSWTTWDTAYNLVFADVNADGRADLIGRNSAGNVQVALSTGTKFNTSSTWTTWNPQYDMQIADMNGDGYADIAGRFNQDVQVGLSTGNGFSTSTRWTTWTFGFASVFVDVTGDGRADILGNSATSDAIRVGVSSGSGFFASSQWTTWNRNFLLTVGDVNGDGRADLVGRSGNDVQVGISRGESGKFAPSTRWTLWATTHDLKLADTNGDGRLDIIGRSGATIEVGPASN